MWNPNLQPDKNRCVLCLEIKTPVELLQHNVTHKAICEDCVRACNTAAAQWRRELRDTNPTKKGA